MIPGKLLYIGTSNRRFTNGKLYSYTGWNNLIWYGHAEYHLSVTVTTNNGAKIYFNEDYDDYFEKNFKLFINQIEYNKYIRKIKLKKIDENIFKK